VVKTLLWTQKGDRFVAFGSDRLYLFTCLFSSCMLFMHAMDHESLADRLHFFACDWSSTLRAGRIRLHMIGWKSIHFLLLGTPSDPPWYHLRIKGFQLQDLFSIQCPELICGQRFCGAWYSMTQSDHLPGVMYGPMQEPASAHDS
jgi:hypothetical protein